MVVRFTWKLKEWREAHLLATTNKERASGTLPITALLAGLTAMGGVGDLCRALRGEREAILSETLLPMLVLICGLCAALAAVLALLRRRDHLRDLPEVPQGEQQVMLHETGWAAAAQAEVRGWSEVRGQRTGRHVVTLLTCDGDTVSLPLRALTEDQGGWLERLLFRKVPRLT